MDQAKVVMEDSFFVLDPERGMLYMVRPAMPLLSSLITRFKCKT